MRGSLVLLAIASLLALASSAPAHAQESVTVHDLDPRTGAEKKEGDSALAYFTPGALITLAGGMQHAVGYGVEGSYMYYPYGKMPSIAYGGTADLQLYDGKYLRTGLAAQVAFGVAGAAAGMGFRQGDGTYASTFSADVHEFLSLGWVVLEARQSVPLVAFPSSLGSYGFETAFALKLAIPICVRGEDPTGMVVRATGRGW